MSLSKDDIDRLLMGSRGAERPSGVDYEKLIDYITAIHSTIDFEPLINLLLTRILGIFSAEVGGIVLFKGGGAYYLKASLGLDEEILRIIRIGDEKRSILDVFDDSSPFMFTENVSFTRPCGVTLYNLLVIPLLDEGEMISAVVLGNLAEWQPDEYRLRIVEFIAVETRSAIRNAFKALETEESLSEMAALYDFHQSLAGMETFEQVGECVINTFETVFGYADIGIFFKVESDRFHYTRGNPRLPEEDEILPGNQFYFEDRFRCELSIGTGEDTEGYIILEGDRVPAYRRTSLQKSLLLFAAEVSQEIRRLKFVREARAAQFFDFGGLEDLAKESSYQEPFLVKNLGLLLNELPSGIFLYDARKHSIVFNKAIRKLFQIDDRALLEDRKETVRKFLGDEVFNVIGELASGISRNFRTEIESKKANRYMVYSVSLSRIGTVTDGAQYVVGIVEDVTQRKKMETALRRTERLAALGELALGVAHEIKNPLTSIKGFSQILPTKADQPGFIQKYSGIVQEEVERLNHIVEELLHFARPVPIEVTGVEMENVIERVHTLVKRELEKNGIEFVREIHPELSIIRGDESQLVQVLLNFILNAIQAMKGNAGIIRVQVRHPTGEECQVYNFSDRKFCVISVEDTGEGMDEETRKRLFDPFFTTKEEGTGLGLSISLRIIEEHEGMVDVESEPGGGSTFKIFLPVT